MLKQMLMEMSRPILIPITRYILSHYYKGNRPLSNVGHHKRVCILAPHMDDETIGLGGTIKLHAEHGAHVTCVFTSDGANSTSVVRKDRLSNIRKQEMEIVKEILGISRIEYMDLPDGDVKSTQDAQRTLQTILEDIQPDVIYCPPFVDAHLDHIGTTNLLQDTLAAMKIDKLPIRLYEVNCPIPPRYLNCLIDISSTFHAKQKAIEAFQSQQIAFDGFLELNRLKRKLVHNNNSKAVEGFFEMPAHDFIEGFNRIKAETDQYPHLFKQANRTITLLWAIYRSEHKKQAIYEKITQ
ncbi:PIG-L deacetylase family protein [Salirhabdus salicampi]|uniref:PIG-L deacetylase family protein n=1 Tax=Salirhabdus salicampi TaxID=476102 RepID=UPI0020C46BF6|nr:PIG-L family deacetylase [Salirhabdus salicampi]MCP8617491.1 PIG-L family deacetylase [Salirhabdus salicampi]